jgi:hypothetical protein
MRALPFVAVVLLAAAPAVAQSTGKSPRQEPATAPLKPQTSTVSPQTSTVSPQAQEKLREALQRAGFQDIRIVDTTLVIQARTQDGTSVVMYVNPTGLGSDSSAAARTETPHAPEAPVLKRADERLKYRPEEEPSKRDPNKPR